MGDFNVNHLNYDTRTATNGFANSLFSNNSLPYINQPTRISAHSSTLLDNMFVDLLNATIVSGNILMKISDHLPQLLICTTQTLLKTTHQYINQSIQTL